MEAPAYLALYDKAYFEGSTEVSSYAHYSDCKHILVRWSDMIEQRFHPTSVLDVGAAYGYVVEWFRTVGTPAEGVEPSDWARNQSTVPLYAGFLPQLPIDADVRVDVVLCTEVLEHVPLEDIPAALQELARVTGRWLVLLVMLEGHPTAHDDAGHVSLRPRAWWEAQLDATGLVPDRDAEAWLDEHPYSEHIKWTGRFFVRKRA